MEAGGCHGRILDSTLDEANQTMRDPLGLRKAAEDAAVAVSRRPSIEEATGDEALRHVTIPPVARLANKAEVRG